MNKLALVAFTAASALAAAAVPIAPLPSRLSETGLYVDGTHTVRSDHLAYAPQYPLWSDGATKRRWLSLAPGTAIDASDPDAWQFPPGTRVWKEFGFARPIETRMIERLPDGTWRFAAYAWNEDGTDAVLVPAAGAVVQRDDVPGGRYRIPSRDDCLACHEGPAVPILGFGALQLSPDRDLLAPHAESPAPTSVDLPRLVELGRVTGLPRALVATAPRIDAHTPVERAALGYLHANCGHCHNDAGALGGLELSLLQSVGDSRASTQRTRASLVGHGSRYQPTGVHDAQRVANVAGGTSVLTQRMQSRSPLARMPPLGVQIIDAEGVALVERWIRHDLQRPSETAR